jgi:hypothetical protein
MKHPNALAKKKGRSEKLNSLKLKPNKYEKISLISILIIWNIQEKPVRAKRNEIINCFKDVLPKMYFLIIFTPILFAIKPKETLFTFFLSI